MNRTQSSIFLVLILCAACATGSLIGCAPQEQISSKGQPETNPAGRVAPAPVTNAAPPAGQVPAEESSGTVAKVGAGKKGHAYGGGIITEPASQYWKLKEKIAFDIQIPHAMNLYKAVSANGKGPKSHEEFMKDIIQAGNVKLPELPEGLVYQYDPNTELLMVVSQTTGNEPTGGK